MKESSDSSMLWLASHVGVMFFKPWIDNCAGFLFVFRKSSEYAIKTFMFSAVTLVKNNRGWRLRLASSFSGKPIHYFLNFTTHKTVKIGFCVVFSLVTVQIIYNAFERFLDRTFIF